MLAIDLTTSNVVPVALAYGFGSAFLPFLNAELFVAAAVAALANGWWWPVLALSMGQTVGKCVMFLGARHGASWLASPTPAGGRPARELTGWRYGWPCGAGSCLSCLIGRCSRSRRARGGDDRHSTAGDRVGRRGDTQNALRGLCHRVHHRRAGASALAWPIAAATHCGHDRGRGRRMESAPIRERRGHRDPMLATLLT